MIYKDLRDFTQHLESQGLLKRISHPVDPDYEMTEISDRTLRAGGPRVYPCRGTSLPVPQWAPAAVSLPQWHRSATYSCPLAQRAAAKAELHELTRGGGWPQRRR